MEFSEQSAAEERFRAMRETLRELRDELKILRDKVETDIQWRSRTEGVIDSMIERLDSAVDDIDGVKAKQSDHQSFIDNFKGGRTALLQTIILGIAAMGSVATFVKLVFFQH